MARTKSAESIDAKISKLDAEISKTEEKLKKLKADRRKLEEDAILEAYRRSGRSVEEVVELLKK